MKRSMVIMVLFFLLAGALPALAAKDFSISDNGTSFVFIKGDTGNMGINSTTPENRLDVDGSVYTHTNIGIGSAVPAQKLDVAGNIQLPNTSGSATGIIYKGTSKFIHNYQAAGVEGMNTFVGVDAGASMTSGTSDTAVGYGALRYNTTGSYNTALGKTTLNAVSTASNNTAAGYAVGSATGNSNISVGDMSLYLNTGSRNVVMGMYAGRQSGSASNNVFLGYRAGYLGSSASKLYIEPSSSGTPLIYGDFSERYVTVYGNLGVGTARPRGLLEVDTTPYTSPFIVTTVLNVGVGTVTPVARLQVGAGTPNAFDTSKSTNLYVSGDIEFDGAIYGDGSGLTDLSGGGVSGLTTYAVPRASSATVLVDSGIYATEAGNVGIGSIAPVNKLDVDGNVYVKGNMGIGSSVPASQLDIAGNIQLTGIIYKGANRFIHNSGSAGTNTFIGKSSGSYISSGTGNTAVGFQTFLTIKTGSYSSVLGYATGTSHTGSSNIAMGSAALIAGAGGKNVACGDSALYNNNSDYNVAVGVRAGESNSIGSSNVFIGYNAARYEMGTNKLYIEVGDSGNPLIYGEFDNNIATVYGNLGIGTARPRGLLEVDASPYTTPFIVAAATGHNVGIGSVRPQVKLDVDGTIYTHTNISVGTASPADAATGQVTLGGCLIMRNTDNTGWTECNTQAGVFTCRTNATGACS